MDLGTGAALGMSGIALVSELQGRWGGRRRVGVLLGQAAVADDTGQHMVWTVTLHNQGKDLGIVDIDFPWLASDPVPNGWGYMPANPLNVDPTEGLTRQTIPFPDFGEIMGTRMTLPAESSIQRAFRVGPVRPGLAMRADVKLVGGKVISSNELPLPADPAFWTGLDTK